MIGLTSTTFNSSPLHIHRYSYAGTETGTNMDQSCVNEMVAKLGKQSRKQSDYCIPDAKCQRATYNISRLQRRPYRPQCRTLYDSLLRQLAYAASRVRLFSCLGVRTAEDMRACARVCFITNVNHLGLVFGRGSPAHAGARLASHFSQNRHRPRARPL